MMPEQSTRTVRDARTGAEWTCTLGAVRPQTGGAAGEPEVIGERAFVECYGGWQRVVLDLPLAEWTSISDGELLARIERGARRPGRDLDAQPPVDGGDPA